jgi:hypothetical protein
MTIIELLAGVGVENVTVQNLLESMTNMRQTKGGTSITFMTDQVTAMQIMTDTDERIGIVVWLPKDRARQVRAQYENQG